MNCKRSPLLVLAFLFSCRTSHAYVEYAPNQNLADEVRTHSYRILPRGEHYSLALDADFFKPVFMGGDNFTYYKWDYYHGNGYWLTARAEFIPVDRLSINLKTLITQGTSSNGPVYNAMIVPLLALTYQEHVFGVDWETRLSDIGRQTVGTGIFIEEKDTMGGYVRAHKGDVDLSLMVDGTGSYRIEGGIAAIDLTLWNGLIGTTVLVQEVDSAIRPTQFTNTLYSTRRFENGFAYGAEGAFNQNAKAAMGYVSYEGWLGDQREGGFHYFLKPQARYYGDRIMGNLAGRVAHNYISYEQNDKAFTNFMDIMSYGNASSAFALQTNLEYVFNIFYRVYGETEFVDYRYRDVPTIRSLYFRTGMKFYPFKEREDHFGFLIGNKYLIASSSDIDNSSVVGARTYTAPNGADNENKPLFLQQTYFMINYTTKL